MDTLQGLTPEDEGMHVAIRLPDGFPVEDIEQLCSLMADADPFVPAFEPSSYGLYSLAGQVWSLQVEEIETILLGLDPFPRTVVAS